MPRTFAAESTGQPEAESPCGDSPQYPGLSIRIYVEGETNEDGCYMQNFDAEAQYPIADRTNLNYVVEVTNSGDVDLDNPVTMIRLGDFCSTITGTGEAMFPANKTVRNGGGNLRIDEHDVERGYMVLHVECTAECPDPAYSGTVSVSDEITISVCARPEKDIVAFLETEFDGALSEDEITEFRRRFFGDRYEQMKERVMAEEQQASETPHEIVETETAGDAKVPSGGDTVKLVIALSAAVLVFAGIMGWRGRRRWKEQKG